MTAATAAIERWWRHDVEVERYVRTNSGGEDVYAAGETVTGYYSDKTSFSGGEIVSSGRFAFPAGIAYVPVQSRLVLPAKFGGRAVRVVSSSVGDGGGNPTPDHQMVEVL